MIELRRPHWFAAQYAADDDGTCNTTGTRDRTIHPGVATGVKCIGKYLYSGGLAS